MPPIDQQCAYGFPTQDEFQNCVHRDEQSYFNRTRLIPGMNFTCNGTITNVTVGGVMRGNQRMKSVRIKFWKESAIQPGIYHKSNKTIVLALKRNMCNRQDRQCMLRLMDKKQISVEPGDILGIEVPPRDDADFELHSVSAPGLTNYIFKGTNHSRVDLNDRIMETEVQPLIIFGMRSRDSGIILIYYHYY